MADRFDPLIQFLLQIDALKTVERKTYVPHTVRRENSAEHSWHLAMACWAFSEWLDEDYDQARLLQLALVHDLGEIDAGDTLLYSDDRGDAHIAERACVLRLAGHSGNPIADMVPLWDEQEEGTSKEARLLKVVDRLLPFMLNIATGGQAWMENGIRKSQVLAKHEFIASEIPQVHQWVSEKVGYAVQRGWLRDE